MADGTPISYEALEIGTPVLSSTGNQFGTVEHVLQIPEFKISSMVSPLRLTTA